MTLAGNVLGTAEYMSPEQALDSSAIDQRADIYALGCTLFFLLAGRAPYSAPSLMGLLLKHRDAPIPSLCDDRPEVPPALDATFRRMVAKQPRRPIPDHDRGHRGPGAGPCGDRRASSPPRRPAPGARGSADLRATVEVDPARPSEAGSTPSEAPERAEAGWDVPSPSEVRRVADLRVVLVEPSRLQSRIVRGYLREIGVEAVSPTDSGAEALAIARSGGADVILSAMHLADMTGLDLAQALRDSADVRRGRLRPRLGRVGRRAISHPPGRVRPGPAPKALRRPRPRPLAGRGDRPRPGRDPGTPHRPSMSARAPKAQGVQKRWTSATTRVFCAMSIAFTRTSPATATTLRTGSTPGRARPRRGSPGRARAGPPGRSTSHKARWRRRGAGAGRGPTASRGPVGGSPGRPPGRSPS